MPENDVRLIRSWVKGDRGSFEELYNKYKNSLFRYLVFILRDVQAAEDIFHRTFIRFFENAGRLAADPFLNFKSWIFKVAVNLCRDEVKCGYRRNIQKDVSPENLPFEHIRRVEERLEHARISEEIDFAIRDLPEKFRQVIGLYYYAELALKDISGIAGIPEGTVKSRLNKAFRLLADSLKGLV